MLSSLSIAAVPSILVLDFLFCLTVTHGLLLQWRAPLTRMLNLQVANFCVCLNWLCVRGVSYLSNYFLVFFTISFCFFSLFSHRVFNVTGHGTVAPLTKRSAGCAGTSLPRPSPLLLLQLALPQQTLLQGIVSVHLVSLLPFLRLAPCGQPHSYCSHSSSTGVYRGPAVTYLG